MKEDFFNTENSSTLLGLAIGFLVFNLVFASSFSLYMFFGKNESETDEKCAFYVIFAL